MSHVNYIAASGALPSNIVEIVSNCADATTLGKALHFISNGVANLMIHTSGNGHHVIYHAMVWKPSESDEPSKKKNSICIPSRVFAQLTGTFTFSLLIHFGFIHYRHQD